MTKEEFEGLRVGDIIKSKFSEGMFEIVSIPCLKVCKVKCIVDFEYYFYIKKECCFNYEVIESNHKDKTKEVREEWLLI